MVEIGSVLREARERRGLELGAIERETHIRERYLAALEEERFERLPGRAYAKGFLRVYSDFLGLDGPLLVEEFNARFPEAEQPELAPSSLNATPARSPARRLQGLLVAGLAVALVSVLAWRMAARHPAALPASQSITTQPSTTVAAAIPQPVRHAAAVPAHLVLHARGLCWLLIRAQSAAGPVLYEGTLGADRTLRYTLAAARPQLWLRIGAPWNLQLSLNGKRATALPRRPGNILVTRSGWASRRAVPCA